MATAPAPVAVTITGDAKDLFQALERSTAGVKNFAKDVEKSTGALGNVVSNLKAPFLALVAVLGGGAFLKSTVTETVEWTKESIKLSKILGITTEQASVLNLAIGDIYGSMDEFLPVVAKLTKTLNTDEDAFHRLGVATRDNQGHLRNTVDIMQDTNSALLKIKSGTDRNIESARIYGKGWLEVQKYLGLTNEVMKEAQEKAQRLNLIVGQDSVEATRNYRASVNDLEDTVKALKIRIGNELLPVISALNYDLSNKGPEAVGILGTALSGIYQMVNAVGETFQKLFENLAHGILSTAYWIAAGAEMASYALRGKFAEAKQSYADYLKRREIMAYLHAKKIKEIEDSYTDSTMRAMGLGPKVKGAPDLAGGSGGGAGAGKPKENAYAEDLARIEKERVKVGSDLSERAKWEAQFRGIQAEHEERIAKYQKEVSAGTLKPEQARELIQQSAALVGEQEKALLDKIQQEIEAQDQKIFEERAARQVKHQEALLDLEKADIERQRDLEQISAVEAINRLEALEEKRYLITRKALERRLTLGKLEPLEREKIISELDALEDKRTQDKQTSGSQRTTAKANDRSQNTFMGGLASWMQKSKKELKSWGTFAQNIADGFEQSFSAAFQGVLSGNMTLGQAMKTIWQGIASSVIQALGQMLAKEITVHAAEMVMTEEKTAADTVGAVAGFTEAHASIPYVGWAIALAFIGAFLATLSSVKGRAVGGLVSSPELTLLGEAGPEVVAPEADFKDWAASLVLGGADLQSRLVANVLDQERQAQAYQSLGSSYARVPRASAGSGYSKRVATETHLHIHAPILDTSGRGRKQLATLARSAMDQNDSRETFRLNANRRVLS